MQAIGLFNVYMSNPHLKEDLFPKSKKKTDITIPRRARATFHCHLKQTSVTNTSDFESQKRDVASNFTHHTLQDNC